MTGAGTRELLAGNASFRLWLASDVVRTLGFAVSTVVLPILVYERTGSPVQTGLLAALRVVPYLAVGLVAGAIADRVDRRRLLIAMTLVEGLAMTTIPVVDAVTPVPIVQIWVVTLVGSTAFVFADAAAFGALPTIVGPERLAAANGVLLAVVSAAMIGGPAIGSALVATVGAASAIWVDVAGFALGALLLTGVRGSFREPRIRATLRSHAAAGLRFVVSDRTLCVLLVAGFAQSLAIGAVAGQLVVYAVEGLGIAEVDARVGWLFSAGAVGTLLAGLVFARLFDVGRVRLLTPGALLVGAGALAVLAASGGLWLAAAGYLLFGAATQIAINTGITYRQLVSPPGLVSSVNVIGRMVAWGGNPFGAMLAGFVAAAAGVRTAFWAGVVVLAVTALATAVCLPGRGPRRS
ncbi:MFS transporter [Pseudonocardia sp. N23]|uniref:MFS transporter n=1 Tax=Pseudonocardia sp. N23 TaxID=1987376 RepID=UPI000BFE5C13|nr:MFS transporter [Pseudonocardia sp. N23]GAY09002.1 major facilitator superfamily MFS_1 [Pseudonocardia sp. N23]